METRKTELDGLNLNKDNGNEMQNRTVLSNGLKLNTQKPTEEDDQNSEHNTSFSTTVNAAEQFANANDDFLDDAINISI